MGSVFSFMVDDGFKRHPIAIHIPPQLNEKYLTRGQEYMLRVKIGDNGILVVEEISNT